MGKTYATDREHQKRHFVRQSKDRYYNVDHYDTTERSFKTDDDSGSQKRGRLKVKPHRPAQRAPNGYEDDD
jgi:hypothetical protein